MDEAKKWSQLFPVHTGSDRLDGVHHGDKLPCAGSRASV